MSCRLTNRVSEGPTEAEIDATNRSKAACPFKMSSLMNDPRAPLVPYQSVCIFDTYTLIRRTYYIITVMMLSCLRSLNPIETPTNPTKPPYV